MQALRPSLIVLVILVIYAQDILQLVRCVLVGLPTSLPLIVERHHRQRCIARRLGQAEQADFGLADHGRVVGVALETHPVLDRVGTGFVFVCNRGSRRADIQLRRDGTVIVIQFNPRLRQGHVGTTLYIRGVRQRGIETLAVDRDTHRRQRERIDRIGLLLDAAKLGDHVFIDRCRNVEPDLDIDVAVNRRQYLALVGGHVVGETLTLVTYLRGREIKFRLQQFLDLLRTRLRQPPVVAVGQCAASIQQALVGVAGEHDMQVRFVRQLGQQVQQLRDVGVVDHRLAVLILHRCNRVLSVRLVALGDHVRATADRAHLRLADRQDVLRRVVPQRDVDASVQRTPACRAVHGDRITVTLAFIRYLVTSQSELVANLIRNDTRLGQ